MISENLPPTTTIIVKAAHKNFRSISFIKLLREKLHMDLKEAKVFGDSALAGYDTRITVPSADLGAFVQQIREFGAIVTVEK